MVHTICRNGRGAGRAAPVALALLAATCIALPAAAKLSAPYLLSVLATGAPTLSTAADRATELNLISRRSNRATVAVNTTNATSAATVDLAGIYKDGPAAFRDLTLSGSAVTDQRPTNPSADGRYSGNSDNVTVDIPAGSNGVQIGRYTQLNVGSGSGTLGTRGHLIGIMGQVNNLTYTTQPLVLGIESQAENNGNVSNMWMFDYHLLANYGSVGAFIGYLDPGVDTASGGNYGSYVGFQCADAGAIPNLSSYAYCLYNLDPRRQIVSMAPYLTSLGQELSAQSAGVAAGRYYYGVQPAPGSPRGDWVINSRMYGIFFNPTRTTYSKIGVNIAIAGSASDTCSLTLYAGRNGIPAGAPVIQTQTVSAATTGDIEATGSFTLDEGLYFPAIFCSNHAIAVRSYQDLASTRLLGAGSSAGTDTTPYTGDTGTFPTDPGTPALTQGTNYMGQQVQIWLRK